MNTGIVFVEGDYDFRIMTRIVPSNALVVLGAGKYGQKAFIHGYAEASGAAKSNVLVGFRDRDFDQPIPQTPQLTVDGNIAFSYRRTIENYLLRPESFENYLADDHSKQFSMLSRQVISEMMVIAAKEIKYYQAARQALGEVRRRNLLETTWTKGSGNLPDYLDEGYCLSKAKELLQKYVDDAREIGSQNEFVQLYTGYCSSFDDPFFAERRHEVWFQGKDMEKALQKQIQTIAPPFPMKRLYDHAISNFDPTPFPDLMEFVTWVSQKIEQQ